MTQGGKSKTRAPVRVLQCLSADSLKLMEILLETCSNLSRWIFAIVLCLSLRPCKHLVRGTVTFGSSSASLYASLGI